MVPRSAVVWLRHPKNRPVSASPPATPPAAAAVLPAAAVVLPVAAVVLPAAAVVLPAAAAPAARIVVHRGRR